MSVMIDWHEYRRAMLLFGKRTEAVHWTSKNLKVERRVGDDQSDRLISRCHSLIIDSKDFIANTQSTLAISKTIVIDLDETSSTPGLPRSISVYLCDVDSHV